MSHFTVLVPARDREHLEAVLLPYHEYECTGIEEYTEFVVEHTADEAQAAAEAIVAKDYVQEDVELKAKYEKYLGDGDVAAIFEDWDGYTLDDEGNVGRKTNPRAKWDGWQVGGRWTGLLKLRTEKRDVKLLRGAREVAGLSRTEVDFLVNLYQENHGKFNEVVRKYEGKEFEIRAHVKMIASGGKGVPVRPKGAENGSPGLMTPPNADPERADVAYARDVDWDDILAGQLENKMETYRKYQDCLARLRRDLDGVIVATPPAHRSKPDPGAGNDLVKGMNADKVFREAMQKAKEMWRDREYCREAFETVEDYTLSLAVDRMLMEQGIHRFDTFQESSDLFYKSEDEYQEMFAGDALTYAFVDLDGKWNQRGEMGWFGMSDESQGTNDYDETFWDFIRTLPPDQKVYTVDCHI